MARGVQKCLRLAVATVALTALTLLVSPKEAAIRNYSPPTTLPKSNIPDPNAPQGPLRIPGYELRKAYAGAAWRRGPALVEEAKRRVDPGMPPLEERVFLVTGATKGHGLETTARLLDAGCTVIMHGKIEGRLRKWALDMGEAFETDKIDPVLCDLSESEEVEALANLIAEKHPRIHGILHNAATIDGKFTGKRKYTWNYKMEHTMAVNAIAPFQLTSLLMPQLNAAGSARVMFSTSPTMSGDNYLDDIKCERYWTGLHSYRLSKLCLEMVAKEMHLRYGNAPNLTFHSFHPGSANTKLMRQGAAAGTGRKLQRNKKVPHDQPSYLPTPRSRKTSFFAMVDDVYQRQSGTFVSDGNVKSKAWRKLLQILRVH
ncbi:unnamed protein product [Durusdinium trenchii]|uniref:Uncharacterized protein n=1 Tax=Durusdinium trenchii TaxID=1381693 RepID=A0ABP0KK43_9DINO